MIIMHEFNRRRNAGTAHSRTFRMTVEG